MLLMLEYTAIMTVLPTMWVRAFSNVVAQALTI